MHSPKIASRPTGKPTQMNISESKPLCTPCHFRADGVFCAEGTLYYSKPDYEPGYQGRQPGDYRLRIEHEDETVQFAVYKPVAVEGETVTCTECDGKGFIVTPDGRQLLMFLETFARPLLRDLVDEL